LAFLANAQFEAVRFDEITPSVRHDWTANDTQGFDLLLQIADRETKATQIASQEQAIFKLYSLGISTNRDEWLYDVDLPACGRSAALHSTVRRN